MNNIAALLPRSPRAALLLAAALLFAELGALGVIFKHAIAFECRANWPERVCSGADEALVALYCLLGALALFGMLRTQTLRPQTLQDVAGQAGERLWPLALNAGGVVLALVPVTFLREGSGAVALIPSFGFWGAGMGLLLGGLMLYLAPLPHWRAFLAGNWATLVPVLAAGALAR